MMYLERARISVLMRVVLAGGLLLVLATGQQVFAAHPGDEAWAELRSALFADRPIMPGQGVISLEAPYRAQDAAIVPISMVAEIPQSPQRYIKALTLIIDNNPAPVAAVFQLSPRSGTATRITNIDAKRFTAIPPAGCRFLPRPLLFQRYTLETGRHRGCGSRSHPTRRPSGWVRGGRRAAS